MLEAVSWASSRSVFTASVEELTAYLAQVTDRTTVGRVLGISWQAVGSIVERVVARRLDESRCDGLRRIGIDEFSYRKRHHYLTIVVDHDRQRVVWVGKGRSAKTLETFFGRLPGQVDHAFTWKAAPRGHWTKSGGRSNEARTRRRPRRSRGSAIAC